MEKKRQSKMRGGVLIGIVLLLIISLVVGACAKAPAPAAPTPGATTPAPGAPTPAKPAAPGAPTPAPAAVKPIELVFSSGGLKTSRTTSNQVIVWYLEEIKKRTGGRVVYKEYWGGALASTTLESWELIKRGAIDLVALCPTCVSEEIFKWDIPWNSFPGLFKTPQEALRISTLLYEELPFLHKQWQDNGVQMAMINLLGPYQIVSNVPLKTLDDFKGKKIYAWNTYTSKFLSSIGGVPMPITTAAEQYDALRTGLFDGLIKPADFVYANKIWEVAKYFTFSPFGGIYCCPYAVNLKRYNDLPDDIKKIMQDLWLESADVGIYWHETLLKESLDAMKARGMTFFYLSQAEIDRWVAAYGGVEGMAEVWLTNLEKKHGIPRAEPMRFLNRQKEMAAPGWKIANPDYPPDWVYKSPVTGKTLPRIYPLTP